MFTDAGETALFLHLAYVLSSKVSDAFFKAGILDLVKILGGCKELNCLVFGKLLRFHD